ncbi:MAG: hypothetical protein QM523_08440 [Candidatus Pacebacteria bacterium]|nr:hypothetical protein [Candidatus Paceibacterota bacterium]
MKKVYWNYTMKFLVIFLFVSLLPGCATILSGTTQTIVVKPKPADAKCSVMAYQEIRKNERPYSDKDREEYDISEYKSGIDNGLTVTRDKVNGKQGYYKNFNLKPPVYYTYDLVTEYVQIGMANSKGEIEVPRMSGDSVDVVCKLDGYKESKTVLKKDGINSAAFIIGGIFADNNRQYSPSEVNVELKK